MQEMPRACKTINEMKAGDRIEVKYQITEDDVQAFACLSGDWNPVHFDEDYASGSIFKKKIAHGLISIAKFSGIFGMDLPGLGTVWEAQEVKFLAPAYLNETYTAVAQVQSIERRRVVFSTWVEDEQGKRIVEGKGTVIPISETTRRKMSISCYPAEGS